MPPGELDHRGPASRADRRRLSRELSRPRARLGARGGQPRHGRFEAACRPVRSRSPSTAQRSNRCTAWRQPRVDDRDAWTSSVPSGAGRRHPAPAAASTFTTNRRGMGSLAASRCAPALGGQRRSRLTNRTARLLHEAALGCAGRLRGHHACRRPSGALPAGPVKRSAGPVHAPMGSVTASVGRRPRRPSWWLRREGLPRRGPADVARSR
jgi:hypothetical protein